MHYQSLESEKYLNEKQEAEVALNGEKYGTPISSVVQFLVAIGLIFLVINYADQVGSAAHFLQNWFNQIVR